METDMSEKEAPRRYGMTDITKNDRIINSENRRFDITSDIEDLLDGYSLHTKNKAVSKRKSPLGKSPNDWQR
jgi:hypothetical protein